MQRQRFSPALTTTLLVFTVILANAAAAAGNEKVIHTFAYGKRGALPTAPLIFDSAGNLYGTTDGGGSHNLGTVFELIPKPGGGWTERVLHTFTGKEGANPYSGLVFDTAGNLYGTTTQGGAAGFGTVFELTPKAGGSWNERVLYSFTGGTDGVSPTASLIFDSAGDLYGTTFTGGGGCCGTVFELTPKAGGWTESVLHSFTGEADGQYPYANLIFDPAGNLYGTTVNGGASGAGTVFALSPNGNGGWTESVIYSFTGGGDGADPYGSLIFDALGNLYGTSGFGTVFELTPQAGGGWTESVLYTFNNGSNSSNYLLAGLVFDAAGSLYGTTYEGGNFNSCKECGVVFELTLGANGHWTETALYNFTGKDGEHPYASLIFDTVGNLYGTAGFGGHGGNGSVFKLTPKSGGWSESVICAFNDVDGENSLAGLIADETGNLYGTTLSGGAHNAGAVFELTPTATGWNERVLYSFKGYKDGASPLAGLVFDSTGNLYGTTSAGGSHDGGTAFELTPDAKGGWSETLLYSFCARYLCKDGTYPVASLTLDAVGNLYGTTSGGGSNRGQDGTVFELKHSKGGWTETVLHSFCWKCGDEGAPRAGVIFDSAGNLYGTTGGGGTGSGTVFELTPASNGIWGESVLYSFRGGKDGDTPEAGLIFDAAGNLYGTTVKGGASGAGTVFALSPNGNGGWTENVLYSFTGGGDGAYPYAGLLFDAAGNLYGATGGGPANGCGGAGCGTVFELTPSSGGWVEKTLLRFTGGKDGGVPYAGLISDATGNLYGTTEIGGVGVPGAGVVFEITP